MLLVNKNGEEAALGSGVYLLQVKLDRLITIVVPLQVNTERAGLGPYSNMI